MAMATMDWDDFFQTTVPPTTQTENDATKQAKAEKGDKHGHPFSLLCPGFLYRFHFNCTTCTNWPNSLPSTDGHCFFCCAERTRLLLDHCTMFLAFSGSFHLVLPSFSWHNLSICQVELWLTPIAQLLTTHIKRANLQSIRMLQRRTWCLFVFSISFLASNQFQPIYRFNMVINTMCWW